MFEINDKRNSRRYFLKIPVLCELTNSADNSTRIKNGLSQNLSSESIYFETDEPLVLNSELGIKFQLPQSENTINATVRVCRVESIGVREFGMGGMFVKISDKEKDEIKRLVERLDINRILDLTIKKHASDLHLTVNNPPILRVNGELEVLPGEILTSEDIQQLVYSIMSKQQIKKIEEYKELDFGLQFDIQNRFRINLHQQRGFLEAAFRLISTKISSFEELNIPEVVKDLAGLREGLVLITGPTGSGKTTTMAAMVELINRERKGVIITLERPIEYVHSNAKCIIKQREVGVDTQSFSVALKNSLRQDPNVIVVGELDDIETIRTAITAAEAGYLVIASFHAPNTTQSIDRLASIFPSESRRFILSQLSSCLKGIVCQLLIPCHDKRGRVLTTEIVVATDAVKRIIRNDELVQLSTMIQTGGPYKMHSMFDSIKKWLERGAIDNDTATFYSAEFSRYSH